MQIENAAMAWSSRCSLLALNPLHATSIPNDGQLTAQNELLLLSAFCGFGRPLSCCCPRCYCVHLRVTQNELGFVEEHMSILENVKDSVAGQLAQPSTDAGLATGTCSGLSVLLLGLCTYSAACSDNSSTWARFPLICVCFFPRQDVKAASSTVKQAVDTSVC
eukprot:jgi/Ulvmu1/10727/UM068_0015.1